MLWARSQYVWWLSPSHPTFPYLSACRLHTCTGRLYLPVTPRGKGSLNPKLGTDCLTDGIRGRGRGSGQPTWQLIQKERSLAHGPSHKSSIQCIRELHFPCITKYWHNTFLFELPKQYLGQSLLPCFNTDFHWKIVLKSSQNVGIVVIHRPVPEVVNHRNGSREVPRSSPIFMKWVVPPPPPPPPPRAVTSPHPPIYALPHTLLDYTYMPLLLSTLFMALLYSSPTLNLPSSSRTYLRHACMGRWPQNQHVTPLKLLPPSTRLSGVYFHPQRGGAPLPIWCKYLAPIVGSPSTWPADLSIFRWAAPVLLTRRRWALLPCLVGGGEVCVTGVIVRWVAVV